MTKERENLSWRIIVAVAAAAVGVLIWKEAIQLPLGLVGLFATVVYLIIDYKQSGEKTDAVEHQKDQSKDISQPKKIREWEIIISRKIISITGRTFLFGIELLIIGIGIGTLTTMRASRLYKEQIVIKQTEEKSDESFGELTLLEKNFETLNKEFAGKNLMAREQRELEVIDLLKIDELQKADSAKTLNNLGVLYWNKEDYPVAEESYKEALKTYRELAEQNPDAYRSYVAVTLYNLGILYRNKNDYSEAEKYYKDALTIQRELAENNPDTYLPDVAATLNNLGVLYWNKKDYHEAEKSYKEALVFRRVLAYNDPDTYLPYVALTLNNLGGVQKRYDYIAAEASYREALEIQRKLIAQNPDSCQPNVVLTLANLSSIYKQDTFPDEEKFLKYAKEAEEALAMCTNTPFEQEQLAMAIEELKKF